MVIRIKKPEPWTKVGEGIFSARITIQAEYGNFSWYETRIYRAENPENLDKFISKCQEWRAQGLHLTLDSIHETPEYKALGRVERIGKNEILY